MSSPLIGVTTHRRKNSAGLVVQGALQAYVEALSDNGACPMLIPLGLPEDRLDDLAQRLDGILFAGGGDIHPSRYNSQPHHTLDGIDEDRDRVEIELIRLAIQRGIPFLGICRGLQVINVYEDLRGQRHGSLKHDYKSGYPRDYLAHAVEVQPNTRLAQALGLTHTLVNSIHHQGIRDLASDLVASAWAPDGVIEAVELRKHPFGLAVQWHPEWLQQQPAMRALFVAFVKNAEARHGA